MNYKRILNNNNEMYKRVEIIIKDELSFISDKWSDIDRIINSNNLEGIDKNELDAIVNNEVGIKFYKIQEELIELLWDIESINYELKMKHPSISERMSIINNNLNFSPSLLNMSCVKNRVSNNFFIKIGQINQINIQFYPGNLKVNERKIFDFLDWLEKLEHLKKICKLISRLLKHINCNYIDIDDEEKTQI